MKRVYFALSVAVFSGAMLAARVAAESPGAHPGTPRSHTSTTVPGGRLRPSANSFPRSVFVAGGATLPALGYSGANALSTNPALPAAGSVFGYFATLTGITTQYCQNGSGFGLTVFDGETGNAASAVNAPCAPLGFYSSRAAGLGAPPSLALTDPDIVGSEIPLSQAQYSDFIANRGATRGEPVQIPALISSIALVYNYPSGAITLKLTDSQICALVEGKIANWSQLGLASHALTFIGRADSAGTTFAFSNHLSAVCTSSSGLNTSAQFVPESSTSGPYVQPNPSANMIGAWGDLGVVEAIVANPYSIGYVDGADARAAKTSTIGYATINGQDPIRNLPEAAFSLTYAGVMTTDSVVVTEGGPATVAALSPPPAKSSCVQLPIPAKYARNTKGYPIVAISDVLFSSGGNGGANAANLVTLVDELNTPSNFGTGKIISINAATSATGTGSTGYSALGSSFNATLETVAAQCIGA